MQLEKVSALTFEPRSGVPDYCHIMHTKNKISNGLNNLKCLQTEASSNDYTGIIFSEPMLLFSKHIGCTISLT
jgi:hypothetical protein